VHDRRQHTAKISTFTDVADGLHGDRLLNTTLNDGLI